MSFVFGGQACSDPLLLPAGWKPLPGEGWPNSFTLTLGGEPSAGWVLLRRDQIDALGIDELGDLVISCDNPQTGITVKNLLIVRTRNLEPAEPDSEDSLHLVRLADRRWLWRAMTPLNKSYNVRKDRSNYYADSRNGGADWTWTTMITDVWDTVGTVNLGAFPGLPFTPDGTPENFVFRGSSAWDALTVMLDRIGCAARWNPIDDDWSIVRVGADDTNFDAALTAIDNLLINDNEPLESVIAQIPEQVRVFFPKVEDSPDSDGCDPYYTVDVTDPDGTSSGVQSGTYAILYDDLHAQYDSTPTLQNTSALSDRATDRATDFFRRIKTSRLSRCYSGIQSGTSGSLLPGAQVKIVRWEDVGAGCCTWVIRHPGYLLGLAESGSVTLAMSPEAPWSTHQDGGLWAYGGFHASSSQSWMRTHMAYLTSDLHCRLASFNGGLDVPQFSGARVNASGSTSSGAATWTYTVQFGVGDYDTSSYFSGSNNTRLTAPEDGKYHIGAIVDSSTTVGDIGHVHAKIFLNGNTSSIVAEEIESVNSYEAESRLTPASDYELSSGDYVELQVEMTSDDGGNAYSLNSSTRFFIHKIGGAQQVTTTTDSDAIHDNVASEISAITAKGSPTTSDFLLIEDAADSNNKKRITIGDLPATASPLTTKGDVYTYSTADARLGVGSNNQILIPDSAQTTGLKWGWIDDLTADASPDGAADYVMTYDANAATHKKVLLDDLPGGVTRDVDTISGATTLTTADYDTVICDCTSAGFTVTLPAGPSNADLFRIVRETTNAGTLTISGNGNSIRHWDDGGSGSTSIALEYHLEEVTLQYDGTSLDWYVVNDGRKGPKAELHRDASSQTLTTSTLTKITLDEETFDFGQIADHASNYRIDIARDGKYLVSIKGAVATMTAGSLLLVSLYLNGTETRRIRTVAVNANEQPSGDASFLLDLDDGDYLELYIAQYTGSNKSTLTSIFNCPRLSIMEAMT